MNTAMQYFYLADGSGYYVIHYLYNTDESDFDAKMSVIVSSVTPAE